LLHKSVKFVVTAGPTREQIDPVRFLSNRSSGKMGYAIAAAAIEAGHDCVLISGPVCLEAPDNARLIRVNSSDEMNEAVCAAMRDCDVLVMCAAVADYKAKEIARKKIKKREENFSLELIPTRDILRSLPRARDFFVVGFAAETDELEKNARAKLRHKNCNMMVANDVSDAAIGMESDENAVTIFFETGESKTISRAPKKTIAHALVKIILEKSQKSFDKKNLRMNDSC
jgi:phosphopantothenoylcysteine decarboxylase / phosphopantothenate---cysteine ligase